MYALLSWRREPDWLHKLDWLLLRGDAKFTVAAGQGSAGSISKLGQFVGWLVKSDALSLFQMNTVAIDSCLTFKKLEWMRSDQIRRLQKNSAGFHGLHKDTRALTWVK